MINGKSFAAAAVIRKKRKKKYKEILWQYTG